VVWRSSFNLVDSLIDSSFKVQRDREDSNDAYSMSYWFIYKTDTHPPLELMSIVCIRLSPVASMNGPLEQPQNFEGKEVDGECRPEL